MSPLDFSSNRPLVMGILNVTPDSFSDGGYFVDRDTALYHAEKMIEEGVDIIDIGGESTRPGAKAVSTDVELQRVMPIVEGLQQHFDKPLSIDTSKTDVMKAALSHKVAMINDVCALRAEGAIEVCANSDANICLMHMQGEPRTMQQQPDYIDVVEDIKQFFQQRIAACEKGGIDQQRLLLDPGFGFGKSLSHNMTLLRRLAAFSDLDCPVLVGLSRKSMLATLLNNAPVDQRLSASLAAAVIAVTKGARIVRVHDVKATVEALSVFNAMFMK